MTDDRHTLPIEQWADEKVKDVLFGLVLNVKLRNAGICRKLICEMDDQQFDEYVSLVTAIFE